MIDFRKGNDLPIRWRFFYPKADGETERRPYDLTGKDVKVVISNKWNYRYYPHITVNGNAVYFTFPGKDQRQCVVHSVTLIENDGRPNMHTIDKITPFRLVPMQEVIESGRIEGAVSTLEIEPLELESEMTEAAPSHPYISLERLRHYLYRVTFDSLPEDNGGNSPIQGACSSYVAAGKLYRNFDWNFDNAATFIVRTRDFEGLSTISGLNDGEMADGLIAQLPYRVVDGQNNSGIMVSTHVLYNDWQWTGCGGKSINLTRLPFLVLTKVKSMASIATDLADVLGNLYAPQGLADLEYLLQILVTDGTTTYVLMPPTSEGESYVLQDATANPKLTNFRWVNRATVNRSDADLQARPTGIERWNAMPCEMEDLRFTKCYEAATRLSEFIGLRGTTKDSTDAELTDIYNDARTIYLDRERDGLTWQTMHSVVYGKKMEHLFIQENWDDDCVSAGSSSGASTYGELPDKPKINNVTLAGNKSLHDLGIASEEALEGKQDTISDLSEIREKANAGKAASDLLNGHSVQKNVPSDAKFTDTIYDDAALQGRVADIEEKIPSQASSSNQLADKDFVNSSIENIAAYYITKDASGNPFATKAELLAATVFYSGGAVRVPTRNDYLVVLADESKTIAETGENPTTRYIFDNGVWSYQYIVNRSGLTAAQWAAVNSGITSEKVAEIDDKVDKVPGKGLSTNDFSTEEKNKLAGLENYDDSSLAGRVSDIEGKEAAWDAKANKTPVASSIPAGGMLPNVFYALGTITEDPNVTLATPADPNIYNEYQLQFSIGATVPSTITFPLSVIFPSRQSWEANMTYEISIVNNRACVGSWSNS